VVILLMVIVAILLMDIDGYCIGGYWCLLLVIILMVISGYWWLFMVILLMIICAYSIDGY
jgi:hypothetical protein